MKLENNVWYLCNETETPWCIHEYVMSINSGVLFKTTDAGGNLCFIPDATLEDFREQIELHSQSEGRS